MQRLCGILIIVTAALGYALSLSMQYGMRLRQECHQLEGNQQALLGRMREYRVRDSLHAATTGVLSLRAEEVEQYCQSLAALVRDLGIKMKRVESVSEQALASRYEIRAVVEDTVVGKREQEVCAENISKKKMPGEQTTGVPAGQEWNDTMVIAQRIRYHDPYLDFDGLIHEGMFEGTIVCRDTLTQFVHRIPRKFLFFRWGTKTLQQEIVSSNPHTRIVYSRFINVVK